MKLAEPNEHDRYVCAQLIAECAARCMPLTLAIVAIGKYLMSRNVALPEDPISFATGGKMTMEDVREFDRSREVLFLGGVERKRPQHGN